MLTLRMPKLEIRRLGPDGCTVAREMFAMMAAVFEERVEAPLDEDAVVALLRRDSFWALVATEDGVVVGGLTAHVLPMTRSHSNELFLYDLAVKAACQRRGIGRALIDQALALARTAGIAATFVSADNEDDHALKFYRSVGGEPSPVTLFTFTD